MKKTLIAVLVVGAVLLVTPPAQAIPANERALAAKICLDDFALSMSAESPKAQKAWLKNMDDKCFSVARSFTRSLGSKKDASPKALSEDLISRVLREYRVTGSQVRRWQDKLGYSYD